MNQLNGVWNSSATTANSPRKLRTPQTFRQEPEKAADAQDELRRSRTPTKSWHYKKQQPHSPGHKDAAKSLLAGGDIKAVSAIAWPWRVR